MICRHNIAGTHQFPASLSARQATSDRVSGQRQLRWPVGLRRPGVTLMLLWEECRAAEPDGYAYSRWCELYRAWEGRLSPTMRQAHPAGERLFVDYAGHTVEIVDGRTGEVRSAQVFVAAMGAPKIADRIQLSPTLIAGSCLTSRAAIPRWP